LSSVRLLSRNRDMFYSCPYISPREQGNICEENDESYSGQEEEESPFPAIKSDHVDSPCVLSATL
jgi:hypothetical protein